MNVSHVRTLVIHWTPPNFHPMPTFITDAEYVIWQNGKFNVEIGVLVSVAHLNFTQEARVHILSLTSKQRSLLY